MPLLRSKNGSRPRVRTRDTLPSKAVLLSKSFFGSSCAAKVRLPAACVDRLAKVSSSAAELGREGVGDTVGARNQDLGGLLRQEIERVIRQTTWGLPMRIERAELLGVRIDPMTMETAVAQCVELCRAPRSSHTVITLNASHIIMMRRNPELAAACKAGDLIVPDGMSVVWALRALGQPAPERVAGVDLMAQLLAAAAKHGLSVYFLGARPEVVNTLVEQSKAKHPGLQIAGFRDGYFGPDQHSAIVEEIRASGADILFVGMPSPFKETWVERHRQELQAPVIVGVGGSFDVLAGFIRRAPLRFQSMGLEWLWRLLMEPRKLWKRYLTTNSEFMWLVGREFGARRLAGLQNGRLRLLRRSGS
jgi:N-acetylglucosaminyldiphosphoundecaprenol N-acetyl-beta-D-mannosaminyltransferase